MPNTRENQTPVIFRKAREDGEITAILPTLPANGGRMVCYAHVGQHSECVRRWVHEDTVPAHVSEYGELLRELESIGYENLRVYRRLDSWMDDIRRRAENEVAGR